MSNLLLSFEILAMYHEEFVAGNITPIELQRSLAGVCIPEISVDVMKTYTPEFVALLGDIRKNTMDHEIIRPEVPEDLAYNLLNAFSREIDSRSYDSNIVDDRSCLVLEKRLRTRLELVGAAWYRIKPLEILGDTVYLDVLYIKEKFRRQKFGERLVDAVIKDAAQQGCASMLLTAPASAFSFYDTLGFGCLRKYVTRGEHFGYFFKNIE